jgi:hypothetical protein
MVAIHSILFKRDDGCAAGEVRIIRVCNNHYARVEFYTFSVMYKFHHFLYQKSFTTSFE